MEQSIPLLARFEVAVFWSLRWSKSSHEVAR
jgi:hypothetical protein